MLSVETMGARMEERLRHLEDDVRAGLHAFVRVGKALREIRDQHLYRVHYDTFGDYCAYRWEMSRSYAYRLIDAAEIEESVSTIGDIQGPRHESHARALAPLKEHHEALVSVWTALRQEHGDELTAEVVHNAVRARLREIEARRPGAAPEPASEPLSASAGPVSIRPQAEITVHATLGAEQAEEILQWIDESDANPPASVVDLRQQIEIQLKVLA